CFFSCFFFYDPSASHIYTLSLHDALPIFTLGVPQAVPGSDWGCPLQITGLNTIWRRPKYVFGIDGLQALHLAMKCADAERLKARSEEHTSELQSRSDLVCRLLLEKKKK